MQTKLIFIRFAAGILILVVAAGSFSAGLYLGQRGYVAELQYQPQNVGLPAGNAPQAGPQAGPPGAPYWLSDVMGRIVSLTATEVTLDTLQRQVTVAVDSSTKFIDEMGSALTSTELKTGDIVAVFGRDVAVIVMRLSPRPNAP